MDETSFQRRHEYVTVVNDLTTPEPRVLYVADGRSRAALDGYFDAAGDAGCGRTQMVAMDMWPAYIGSVREHTEALIAFDRFHVPQHLGLAVDQVRRSENRILRQQGDDRLVKTRYLWPTAARELDAAATPGVHAAASKLRCAWRVRGRSRNWRRGCGTTASGAGRSGCGGPGKGWAIRSRLQPMKKVPRTIKRHWDGVLDAVLTKRHERALRGDQRQDPVDQAARLWLPQPRALPQRHLLPPGRLDLYPDAVAAHPRS